MSPGRRKGQLALSKESTASRLTEVIPRPDQDHAVESRGSEVAIIGSPSDSGDICSEMVSFG